MNWLNWLGLGAAFIALLLMYEFWPGGGDDDTSGPDAWGV